MKQVFDKPFVVIVPDDGVISHFDTIQEAFENGEASGKDYYLAKAIDVNTHIVATEVDPTFQAPVAE